MTKRCAVTGKLVNEYLNKIGVNTPMIDEQVNNVSDEQKIEKIEGLMGEVLTTLGIDLRDDSLEETPRRVAKMFVKEIFSGLKNDNFPKATTVENKFCSGDEFVLEKNITLYSDCEHHLRPIIGKAHVAYIPNETVIGLSKLNRIVQYFGQRPQVQERLNQQIAHAISFITKSEDVIVVIEAAHTCVSQRGIKDTSSTTTTACCLGQFGDKNSDLRKELMQHIVG